MTMTPCEKMGYKVGDKFKVLSSVEGFTEGQEIELYEDDGTDMPLFSGENIYHDHAGGNPGAYFPLSEVEKSPHPPASGRPRPTPLPASRPPTQHARQPRRNTSLPCKRCGRSWGRG